MDHFKNGSDLSWRWFIIIWKSFIIFFLLVNSINYLTSTICEIKRISLYFPFSMMQWCLTFSVHTVSKKKKTASIFTLHQIKHECLYDLFIIPYRFYANKLIKQHKCKLTIIVYCYSYSHEYKVTKDSWIPCGWLLYLEIFFPYLFRLDFALPEIGVFVV